jgi:HAD superfamily hydrolase (TIGR01450 family)
MTRTGLAGSDVPPTGRYDVALLDLDGVVYVGAAGVPGAAEALDRARAAGMRLAFVTNNALRTPDAVAAHLNELGVTAAAGEVVTSAQAASRLLAERLPAGAAVLVVGGEGLRTEVAARGLRVVDSADDEPAAVVQGYNPDIGWRQLAEATIAVRRGALFLATNLDLTIPSARGPVLGNGAMVTAVRVATGVEPLAAGKPDPTMHRETVLRTGARNPIVVGDRLDTDIEGASRVGCASLLVLTGVTSPAMLLAASPEHRPDYVSAGLDGLLVPHPAPVAADGGWTCGGWAAGSAGPGALVLTGAGDDLDALRALCAAAWSADGPASSVRPSGPAAEAAVDRLQLAGRSPAPAGAPTG